jgi:hypothetical protein
MALRQTTLRPGLLVRFNTAIRGNKKQTSTIIEALHITDDGEAKERVEIDRRTSDPDEQAEAEQVRSKMRALVCSACVQTEFNLFCPEDRADKLEKRIEEACALADEFNSRARITRIDASYITAKIDSDDVQAMREIRVEASRLIDEITGRMKGAGLGDDGIEATRDALKKAKRLGRMLSPEAQASLEGTVQMAREALSEIKKVGEANAAEETKRAIAALEQQRLAFLDLSDEGQIEAPAVKGRTVDLVPEEPTKKPATKKPTKKAA